MATTSVTLTQASREPCSSCAQQARALAQAHAQIEELESQIRILTLRATNAVEKATEYETSLRRLNSNRSHTAKQSTDSTGSNRPASLQAIHATQATPVSSPKTAGGRLARLLPSRVIAATPTTAHHPIPTPLTAAGLDLPIELSASALNSPSPSELELIEALSHEHELRRKAEETAAKTNSEIEELTGQLFEQANEMVATERKARAKLEARVEVLEKRDGEKTKRLGMLETRVQRVERIRELLKSEAGNT